MSLYKLKDVRHGRYLFNPNDTYIGRSLDFYGEWSDAEIWLFGQIARPGDTVPEAGANIGSHTAWLSRTVAHGQVFAFEPARHTHQLLCVPNEKMEAAGLTLAQAGDGRLEIGQGSVGFLGEPWSNARLRYR